jgi:hemimethylated DNA binding protein
VDEASRLIQESKGDRSGSKTGAQFENVDLATRGIRLRSELQQAIEEERYQDAARLRDSLKELEDKIRGNSARAGEFNVKTDPQFRLGQRLYHKERGYRVVVVGWDYACCETDEFVARTGAGTLPRGVNQPYYRVLVDTRDWGTGREGDAPLAYLPEEALSGPPEGKSWKQAYGEDPLKHPYSYLLFLGPDNEGNMLPCKQLREKYGVKRRDVPPPPEATDDIL